jgi:hypothetical protein
MSKIIHSDPEKLSLIRITDPGAKKAPDPGSGTLRETMTFKNI